MSETNPCAERLDSLMCLAVRRRLDALVVFNEANIRSLTGVVCDNGCLLLDIAGGRRVVFFTDFRYVPMVHRVAPWLRVRETRRGVGFKDLMYKEGIRPKRLGYESSITAKRYLELKKRFPKAVFVDVNDDLLSKRAVKSVDEITRVAAAAALNDEIWALARKEMKPGMTEKAMQRVIQTLMITLGDGEAFETIVCAGANAAECHHVPDDTVWHKGEPLLVDMGVKLDGVCSDMTRNIKASRDPEYSKIYDIVLKANEAAIAAAKPGMTAGALDAVARKLIRRAGYGKAFGHSLGHGVGYEIHEEPCARQKSKTELEPGMIVTIEPGIYLENRLGVRIEDLVLITTTGSEVRSYSAN